MNRTLLFKERTLWLVKGMPANLHLCQYKPSLKKCSLLFSLLIVIGTIVSAQTVLLGTTSTGGVNGGGTAFSITTTGTNYKAFQNFLRAGSSPQGDLVRGSDGNFYGMTYSGGADGAGTVFKITSSGAMTIVKNLNYSTTGAYPTGSLIQGSDGNFYGMTGSGGTKGYGTIFKISLSGVFTVLNHLDNTTTGFNPKGSLVQGSDGNFYGMTFNGGTNNFGTIFKMTAAGAVTIIKHLDNTTGKYPYGNLIEGSPGIFYGMTNSGGAVGYGTVFSLTVSSGTLTVIRSFDASVGTSPYGSLLKSSDGNFYGMTSGAGANYGGTIFKITSGNTFSVLSHFSNATTGSSPRGRLVEGSDGNLYGMTGSGGTFGYGTIFKCSRSTGAITVMRHLNTTTDGGYPYGSLCRSSDGNFYGMTSRGGGSLENGTIFRISSSGSFSVLLRLPDGYRGIYPYGNLLQGKDGNFYGTCTSGGARNGGTLYKLCPTGSFTTLRSLEYSTTGINLQGSLVQGSDGHFYGMTFHGGPSGYGTVFRMTASGSLTVIRSLTSSTGVNPQGSLVQGSDGLFYGMTSSGGSTNQGTIFKINSSGTLTVIKNLDYSSGANPRGSLVQGKDGYLYGMTNSGGTNGQGTIFRISTDGTVFNILTHLISAKGAHPSGSLMQGSDGNFYGMTQTGGANNRGVIFRLTPTGTYSILKSFADSIGSSPRGDLVQGPDGTLYGMTSEGGVHRAGTVFKIKTDGSSFAVLRNFNPATDGGKPLGSLVIQKTTSLVANPQSFSTPVNTTKKVILTGSGATPLTYSISTTPRNGKASISKDTLIYTPAANFTGNDSLYFTANWGCEKSAPAKVKITVTSTTLTLSEVSTTAMNENEIGEEQTKLIIKVMPNPSTTSFTIVTQSKNPQPLHLRIVDGLGRIVEQRSNLSANGTLTVGNNYKPGLYYAEIMQGNERVVLKLVKSSY